MKKPKLMISFFLMLGMTLAITPPAYSQVGTYIFHGAPGDQKILIVKAANNQSMEDLFGAGYVGIFENLFGVGSLQEGARKKSLVTAVNFSFDVWGQEGVKYTTDNWDWTLGEFGNTSDIVDFDVWSFYSPKNITWRTNLFWSKNTSIYNGALYFAQLPTPVDQYLEEITWAPKWQNLGNTVVHNAEAGDFIIDFPLFPPVIGIYLENCTETWTYDETYGAWIGYQIKDNETNIIYEFSIELPSTAAIPGFEIPILLSISVGITISLIYVIMKKKQLK
ncbi:MAG: hypothetical protein Lokiarch_53660 [Candidatus Lokiarchaeum sp. GC14_75]|nr:MAG: hypothetical protein Lokiarch_53660 [Candidatus Lokiarchaeum sp. GC14_75]